MEKTKYIFSWFLHFTTNKGLPFFFFDRCPKKCDGKTRCHHQIGYNHLFLLYNLSTNILNSGFNYLRDQMCFPKYSIIMSIRSKDGISENQYMKCICLKWKFKIKKGSKFVRTYTARWEYLIKTNLKRSESWFLGFMRKMQLSVKKSEFKGT